MLMVSLQGCYVHRHTVSDGPTGKGSPEYSRGTQWHFIGGLIAGQPPRLEVPEDGNYQFEARWNIISGLVGGLTGGLVVPSYHIVRAKR